MLSKNNPRITFDKNSVRNTPIFAAWQESSLRKSGEGAFKELISCWFYFKVDSEYPILSNMRFGRALLAASLYALFDFGKLGSFSELSASNGDWIAVTGQTSSQICDSANGICFEGYQVRCRFYTKLWSTQTENFLCVGSRLGHFRRIRFTTFDYSTCHGIYCPTRCTFVIRLHWCLNGRNHGRLVRTCMSADVWYFEWTQKIVCSSFSGPMGTMSSSPPAGPMVTFNHYHTLDLQLLCSPVLERTAHTSKPLSAAK